MPDTYKLSCYSHFKLFVAICVSCLGQPSSAAVSKLKANILNSTKETTISYSNAPSGTISTAINLHDALYILAIIIVSICYVCPITLSLKFCSTSALQP